jgi:hypothetical protein
MGRKLESTVIGNALCRLVLGGCGGFLSSMLLHHVLWMTWGPSAYPKITNMTPGVFVVVALLVGASVFSRYAMLRIASWTVAGLGAGNYLWFSCGFPCPISGATSTPAGIILALVFGVIGYRQRVESTRAPRGTKTPSTDKPPQ